jgi:sugar-specific transcriptional regulator TrmB
MEEVLAGLGFTPKDIVVYRYVLEHGGQTAAAIAGACGEKRANTYVILEGLNAKGVITVDNARAVRTFSATHPSSLQKLVQDEQARQARLVADVKSLLPQLTSAYNLATDKPGIVYLQGAEGFITLLEDMAGSQTEVLLVASNQTPSDFQVLKRFRQLLLKRKQGGVITRAIFHHNGRETELARIFSERGMNLRFLGDEEYTGELAIYEDNVVFTVYEPSLVVTVMTNQAIATTMRQLFEQLWQKSTAK